MPPRAKCTATTPSCAPWQGDTGQTYQAWQQQWNQALEEATQAYQAMTQAHEQNTMNMMGRDRAEGSKWG